jgi:hypothetical protein
MRWPLLTDAEHEEQAAVIRWAESMGRKLPELRLLFAIAHGGMRPRFRFFKNGGVVTFSPAAEKLKAEGVKAGVPVLFLPVARQEWHGLFVAMRIRSATTSVDQDIWIGALTSQGYAVPFCRGAEDAINAIAGYPTQSTWSPRRNRR